MPIYHDRFQQIHEKPDGELVRWRISAYGVAQNDKGEILMVLPAWGTAFDLPGGGVEIHERIEEGLRREFYEETGYRVEVESVPFYVGESDFFMDVSNEFMHVLILTYRVKIIDPSKRDAHVVNTVEGFEIRDMKWVKPHDLKIEDVRSIHWPVIQQIQKWL